MSRQRFIFITGGVVSSLGKGLASATLGAVLQSRGFKVRLRKLDPYLNVDPGTMSPYQHGECYVTEDGAETDLDLGHYERFTGVDAKRSDNVTTGSIYKNIIEKERNGDFNGGTVQVIPHVTDAIKAFIRSDLEDEDFVLCEIGGTVGDIESLPFLEAIRQFANEYGRDRSMFIHCTLLPYISAAGELKTKPTQHSVKELLSVGIQPDMLLCRAETTIPEAEIRKIALFCNVQASRVIPALNAKSIYHVPENYHYAGLDREVMDYFHLDKERHAVNLNIWQDITTRLDQIESDRKTGGDVVIGIVGKYVELPDAYKSLSEALLHGALANHVNVELRWIEAQAIESQANETKLDEKGQAYQLLHQCHGILVPGGFGERGVEGKIAAIHYARTHNVPYLGICFGMQMAVIELARSLAGLEKATSSEIDTNTKTPLVGLLTEWIQGNRLEKRNQDTPLGGTMRLGSYPCQLAPDSLIKKIYGGADIIHERHRHRYEVNLSYRQQLEAAGMCFSGMSPDGILPEIIELKDHDWFVGVQFHPELKSRPFAPHPLFSSFIEAAHKKGYLF